MAASAAALSTALPARRALADGKKSDKEIQACLSKCVYEETKIAKGIAKVEVVSREEAFKICKPKCGKKTPSRLTE